MPMYDYKCSKCGHVTLDVYEPIEAPFRVCEQSQELGLGQRLVCAGKLERTWLPGKANSVIGDECDVWVKHGICNEDGTPRHYNSKAEMVREAQRRGLQAHVEHKGTRGGDKSKHTVRWT